MSAEIDVQVAGELEALKVLCQHGEDDRVFIINGMDIHPLIFCATAATRVVDGKRMSLSAYSGTANGNTLSELDSIIAEVLSRLNLDAEDPLQHATYLAHRAHGFFINNDVLSVTGLNLLLDYDITNKKVHNFVAGKLDPIKYRVDGVKVSEAEFSKLFQGCVGIPFANYKRSFFGCAEYVELKSAYGFALQTLTVKHVRFTTPSVTNFISLQALCNEFGMARCAADIGINQNVRYTIGRHKVSEAEFNREFMSYTNFEAYDLAALLGSFKRELLIPLFVFACNCDRINLQIRKGEKPIVQFIKGDIMLQATLERDDAHFYLGTSIRPNTIVSNVRFINRKEVK